MPPPARARTRAKAPLRREQIFEEAIRLIGQNGHNGFTLQALAERCGLTNAGLLYHFGSKDQLLLALLQDRDRRDTEAVASLVSVAEREEKVPLTLPRIQALLHALVARNATQPDLVRLYAVLSAEALDPAHPAHAVFVEREASALALFTRMMAPHMPEPGETARQLVSLMTGLELQWLRTGRAFDLAAAWDRGAALLLRPGPQH